MEIRKEITIRHVEWCEEAIDALSVLPTNPKYDTSGGYERIEAMRDAGAQLFRVTSGDEIIMWYVLGVDKYKDGCEGCVMAAVGGAEGIDITRQVLPLIENQFVNCRTVQIVTKRKGLVEKLSKQGYHCDGYIMRKALNARAH